MSQSDADAERIRASLNDIVRFGLALSGVLESTAYGQPALKWGDRLLFALRKDRETLALVCGFEERAALMREHPETFFLTDHYLNHPSVVVRLLHADKKVLRRAVRTAWERARARPGQKRRRPAAPRVLGPPSKFR
jgi:hypothetical protein